MRIVTVLSIAQKLITDLNLTRWALKPLKTWTWLLAPKGHQTCKTHLQWAPITLPSNSLARQNTILEEYLQIWFYLCQLSKLICKNCNLQVGTTLKVFNSHKEKNFWTKLEDPRQKVSRFDLRLKIHLKAKRVLQWMYWRIKLLSRNKQL